ncbi:MAG: TRAP transporter substrate-binding protein DctP [Synechococcales bacterium]|nr:TRAP transporter substrate-binding protein DctP [Synechococcales bacterium]
MKRRQILDYGVTSALTASALVACSQTVATNPTAQEAIQSLPSVRWRLAIAFPKSVDVLYGAAELVCQRVNQITSGKFVIIPHAPGEIAEPLEVTDAVQEGRAECGFTASHFNSSKSPAFAFFSALPFGLNAQQQNAWLYHGGGLELMQKLYGKLGVKSIPLCNTGTQMGGWFRKEIKSIDDLQGLKFRLLGLAAEVFRGVGGDPVEVPPTEIFSALEQGKLDGAEFIGPHDDEKLGLNRVAPFYYYPGWWEPGTSQDLHINMAAWEALPPEYQQILESVLAEVNIKTLAKYDALNGKALKKLQLQGTKLLSFSDEIMQAAQKTAFEIYEDLARKEADFKEIYDNWKAFREEIYQWHKVGELSFTSFAIANPVTP